MCKSNDNCLLADSELDAVSGGGDLSIQKIVDTPSIEIGGGGAGTAPATPAGAWNDLLHNYGYPRTA